MSPDSSEIVEAQEELIGEFNLFNDWIGRYEYLIDLGKQLADFPEQWKTEQNKIHGCQSQVWIHAEMCNGRLHFEGTSDAAIVRGLIAVLLRVFNDRLPEEVVTSKRDFLSAIGFAEHLSPTRSNGLYAMLEFIYTQAGACTPAPGQ